MKIKVKYPEWIIKTCEELIELRMAQRWIPVGERLPEHEQETLIANDGEVIIATYFNHPDLFCDKGWNNDDYGNLGYDGITHWMPLPEPPRYKK